MAFAVPALASVGSLVGGGAAAGASLLSTGVGIISTITEANYQSQVLKNQAAAAEADAAHQRQAGAVEAQDRAAAAKQEMDLELAQQGSSGFDVNSFSLRNKRALNQVLARRDSLRIVDDAERAALQLENRAANDRASAGNVKRAGVFNALGKGLSLAGSLIGDAPKVNPIKYRKITAGG